MLLSAVLSQRPEALPRGLLQSTSEAGYLVAVSQADPVKMAEILSRFDAGLSTSGACSALGSVLGDSNLGAYAVALHDVVNSAIRAAPPFDAGRVARDFEAALAGGGLGRILDLLDAARPQRRAAAVLEKLSAAQFFSLMGGWLKDESRRALMLAPGPLRAVFERQANSLAALEFHRLAHGQVVSGAGEVVKADLALHLLRVWPLAVSLTTVS
ncbi:MAG: hypothetical protein IT380_29980 [Myxococcales bacterium]|nr:hypothetical protein [Myxococcales bacterium]